MARRILVTGATGTVGSRVIRELSGRIPSGDIVAATRDPARLGGAPDTPRAVRLDMDDPGTIAPAVQGVDTLFLLTGYSVSMLLHSKRILDAAQAAGVRHVVHMGAWGSADSRFQHLIWHDFVERYIMTTGMSGIHLRPKTFMQNVLHGLRNGSTAIRQFYGHQAVGWIDADDIAAVAAACLAEPERHAGKVYELAEDARSMGEVAQILALETGLPFVYEPRDPRDLAAILAKRGMEPAYGESLAMATVAIAEGGVADIDKVYANVEAITGRPASRWSDFARKNRSAFVDKARAPVR